MKSIALLLLLIGIIFIVIGYSKSYSQCPANKIEYRYIPRNIYDEQFATDSVSKTFKGMFEDPSAWSKYPLNSK